MPIIPSSSESIVASGGASNNLFVAKTTIADAQIKTLPTQEIAIASAPGSGKTIQFISAIAMLKWVADYANFSANAARNFSIAHPGAIGTVATFVTGIDLNNFFALGTNALRHATIADGIIGFLENQGLIIYVDNFGTGNFTGGNSGNKLVIEVSYRIVTTPT